MPLIAYTGPHTGIKFIYLRISSIHHLWIWSSILFIFSTCENVMRKNESECLRCECKYESRNTLTIQVSLWNYKILWILISQRVPLRYQSSNFSTLFVTYAMNCTFKTLIVLNWEVTLLVNIIFIGSLSIKLLHNLHWNNSVLNSWIQTLKCTQKTFGDFKSTYVTALFIGNTMLYILYIPVYMAPYLLPHVLCLHVSFHSLTWERFIGIEFNKFKFRLVLKFAKWSTLGTKNSSAILKTSRKQISSNSVNKSEINILLPKPYSLMWHLVRRNRVRNGRDRRLEIRQMRSPKVALLKIPMDSVLYNTEHCGINDDKDDEHIV